MLQEYYNPSPLRPSPSPPRLSPWWTWTWTSGDLSRVSSGWPPRATSAKSTSPHSRTKKQNTDRILLQLTILFFWGRILLLWTAVTNSCVVIFQEPLDERNNWKAELVVLTWLWCFWGRLSEIGLLSDYLQTAGGAQQLLNYHVVAIITNEHYNQYYHLHQMTLNIQKAICCYLPWPVDAGHWKDASSNTSRCSKNDK